MKARQIEKLGIPRQLTLLAKSLVKEARSAGQSPDQVRQCLGEIVADPAAHRHGTPFGPLATALHQWQRAADRMREGYTPREAPAPWRQWGKDLDDNAVAQMDNACELPVSVRGALMPDAHLGYGLPIGGVLATENAVIPYAVGVDIACRMKLTVLDLPAKALESQCDRLIRALETETRFGMGSHFTAGRRRDHEVMDEDWNATPLTRGLKDKAYAQLGTSGSGNHFVEFGHLCVDGPGATALGLAQTGTFLALMTHSGSRGPGSTVAGHYCQVAKQLQPQLPRHLQQLAWIEVDSDEGESYWRAMQLMGRYAAANHAVIHHHIARHLRAHVLADIENHHNFAWRETHDGRDVIVHRKGATPAGQGVLGVIPGSMASPAYVVRGKGSTASMRHLSAQTERST